MNIPDQHISLRSQLDVATICRTLFKSTPVKFFIYVRFYDNGSIISLPSRADWHKHFFQKEYYKSSKLRLVPGYNFWNSKADFSEPNYDAREYFNIDNKFEITIKGHDYHEVFGFASEKGCREAINYYVNNLDQLDNFTSYFKDTAHNLIESCARNHNYQLHIKEYLVKPALTSSQSVPPFLSENQYYLNRHTTQEIGLSNKEMQCMVYTLRGRTAREASSALNISSKTVEAHLANVREKLDINKKSELFDFAYKSGLIKLVRSSLPKNQE